MAGSAGYQVRICVQGELSPAWWSGVFADLLIEVQPGGTTFLSGLLSDQAALHGLLTAIRDLGMTIVSVDTVAASRTTDGEDRGSQR